MTKEEVKKILINDAIPALMESYDDHWQDKAFDENAILFGNDSEYFFDSIDYAILIASLASMFSIPLANFKRFYQADLGAFRTIDTIACLVMALKGW